MSVETAPRTTPLATGPIGRPRDIGMQILLSIVTLGLYGLYWVYTSHEDVRQHTSDGAGGVLGVILWIFAAPVTLFLLPTEIQRMYERDGRRSPVGPATAFWFLLLGIPWFVKCQRSLNRYWTSKAAPAGG